MNEEIFPVPVVLENGTAVEGKFLTTALANNHWSKQWRLSLSFNNRLIAKEAPDCFEALIEIRRELENEGIKVLCYGSCKDVRPSGMSRSMGGGVKAYYLTLGKPAMSERMVHILKTGTDIVPVSVNEQKNFWNEWQKSIGVAK